jgi:2-dehydro-3-deoxygluconokinase
MVDFLSIGECMVEFAREADGRYGRRFGGDTLNTAVYAARSGVSAGYATALGSDPYSDKIRALCDTESIETGTILTVKGRMPGLYLIETDEHGERSFFYWRDRAPARERFELPDEARVTAAMKAAKIVYFSGITLSLYSPAGLDRFHAALGEARAGGTRIAFDGNYRPSGWGGDAANARPVFARFLKLVDIALPSFDDEVALWGDSDPQATLKRLAGHGIGEIALKNGPAGALIADADGSRAVPVPEWVEPVDTTAAGDSFGGAYLAARLKGETPEAAALAGHRMAGHVIRHRGAVVPRA